MIHGMKKNIPYSALRYKNFNVLCTFYHWFWMYSLLSLNGAYSLTKIHYRWNHWINGKSFQRFDGLFAGRIVDPKGEKLLFKCILGFSIISLGLFLFTYC
jgi:hypothetical protein